MDHVHSRCLPAPLRSRLTRRGDPYTSVNFLVQATRASTNSLILSLVSLSTTPVLLIFVQMFHSQHVYRD